MACRGMMIHYKRDECLYRARDDFSKQGELSGRVMSASRNAVRMPTEYALSYFRIRAEVQVFVVFFRRLYRSIREV